MTRSPESPSPDTLKAVVEALSTLRYGSIEIVVHDGRVVQIVRTEKLRVEGKDRST